MGYSGSTGQAENTPVIESANRSGVFMNLQDNGSWYSVITGEHFFAIEGLEGGTTWGRGASHIMSDWRNWSSGNMPKIFLSEMRSRGVPIE